MKNIFAIPNAFAITVAIVYIICRLLISIIPGDLSFAIASSWFHGIQLSNAGSWDLTMSSFILGLVSSAVSAWVIGYIFVLVYKRFSK